MAQAAPLADPAPIHAAVERWRERTIELRRKIHGHPELGEREHETAKLVAEHLSSLGLEVREGVAGTGVVGTLVGGRPGPIVAWRADIDALPVTEATGLPFASTRKDTWEGQEVGVMHACGHDLHTAIALGLAGVLADEPVRAALPGTVLFVFQPAEEGVPEPGAHGARLMLEQGLFARKPEAVFGLHVHPDFRVGEVGVRPGGLMAASDRFKIVIHGKQSHGAYPSTGIDPIVVASHVVTALQTIASRSIDTVDTVVVTVGRISAGNRFNIIPATAEMAGTVRTHDPRIQDDVHRRIREISEGVARALGARAEVTIEKINPQTVNDPGLLAGVRPLFEQALAGPARLLEARPNMAGEDFAYYGHHAPALLYFLGVTPKSGKSCGTLHAPDFSPDESAIAVGLETGAHLLVGWLTHLGAKR